MGKRRKVNTLQDFFSAPDERPEDAVYFERISGYHPEIREFLRKFYTAAASNGVAAEGGIQNPDNSQLSFYAETMGNDFRMEGDFVRDQMGKWLPRLTTEQKDTLASAICETLEELHRAGKNEGSLKNVFVKFMCWLYYRFEPLFHSRSAAQVPKILYEGELSHHALLLLNILSSCGTDIVLLETDGDEAYRKLDPDNRFSEHFEIQDPQEFPAGFSLSVIRKEIQEQQERERLLGPAPCFRACTNTWMAGNVLQEIRKQPQLRGDDPTEYYNVFCRIRGVEDKVSYESELYRLQLDLKKASRKTVIVSNSIQAPTVEEFARIKRGNYQNAGQVAQGLVNNIQIDGQPELEQILRRAFTEAVLDEGEQPDQILGRLATEAACCLCWLKRYQKTLFSDWRMPDVGCFLYLGGCRNLSEALFCRFLAKTPVDVVILSPDLNRESTLSDPLLLEIRHEKSLQLEKYPEDQAGLRLGTTAFHAEEDLNSIMYGDTGLYRNRQFSKANVITLRTMYEEIPVLWGQELKYRPNFSTLDDQVNIPVIFAKVSGVKNRDLAGYWGSIKSLVTEETLVYQEFPHLSQNTENPFMQSVGKLYQNGTLLKDSVKKHRGYPYGLLKESVQDYILDKIELLIRLDLITEDNGRRSEYRIIPTLLNLDRELLRLIQNYDFTKKNPKLICINTGEDLFSKEDAILLAFLNLVGFDVILFVPTGYQCVEQHYTRPILEEHQIGEYLYDLKVPDFSRVSAGPKKALKDFFFRRGN